MRRIAFMLVLICYGLSCTAKQQDPNDPFAGFLGHPDSLEMELATSDGRTYEGSVWDEFGLAWPYRGVREGNIIRGTARVGGSEQDVTLERTPEGIVL